MIWATVSSRSYFCWLYRASPSLVAKNVINLISILTIWWCPCVGVFPCIIGRGCLLWPLCSLDKTLLAFALLHSVLQCQICLLLQVLLSTFVFQYPIMKRISFLGISSRSSCRYMEPFSFFNNTGRGIDLDYCDIEWFALEMNRDHSVIFEIASKYCRVHYEKCGAGGSTNWNQVCQEKYQ